MIKLLKGITDDSLSWWSGQIQKFLFNLKPKYIGKINKIANQIGFKHPIVGVHIEKSDDNYHLKHYLEQVQIFFDIQGISENVTEKRIFLVADDLLEVKNQISEWESNYKFIFNEKTSLKDDKTSWKTLTDVTLLSRCDYFVGTLSSSTGRRVFKLMHQTRNDASERFFSLNIDLNSDLQGLSKFKKLKYQSDKSFKGMKY